MCREIVGRRQNSIFHQLLQRGLDARSHPVPSVQYRVHELRHFPYHQYQNHATSARCNDAGWIEMEPSGLDLSRDRNQILRVGWMALNGQYPHVSGY